MRVRSVKPAVCLSLTTLKPAFQYRNAGAAKGTLAYCQGCPLPCHGAPSPQPHLQHARRADIARHTYHHAAESSSTSSQRVVVTTLLPQNRERVPKMLLLEQNWLPCSFHDSAWIPSSRLKNCVGEKKRNSQLRYK